MISYSMLCCSWSKQAGRSKLAKAVLKLVRASLCSSWSLPNPPGYPQHPADQCVHSPVVAREDVSPVLVGENLLSPNRMTLLLHPLPHRASGASVGDFPSSRRLVVAVAAWKAILLLGSTAADANHHRFHHHGDLVWCRRCVLAIEIRSRANHVSWPLAGKISPIFRMALETSVYLLLLQYSSLLPFPLYL